VSRSRQALRAVPLLVLGGALVACGSDATPAAATGGPVTVTASDDSCELSRTELQAGRNVFEITNTGSKVTEVYVYASGDRIVAEKENIGPGLAFELTTQVPEGQYTIACKPGQVGDGIRTPITVVAGTEQAATDPLETAAVASYRGYVQQQADALVPLVEQFTGAVKAGDVERAKQLYAPSRRPWEAIEPVAESFGDLDPKVDLREADLEPGQKWTGWHALEKALWVDGSTAGTEALADQLLTDIASLRGRIQNVDLSAASIGNGAKELLDEVATGKVTGEEEAFSHTDLVDFEANVAGAKRAYDALRPLVERGDPSLLPRLDAAFTTVERAYDALRPLVERGDPSLLPRLDAAFTTVERALTTYQDGDGYVSYDTVTPAQRRELAKVVNGLGEPLSELAAAASAAAPQRS